MHTVTARASLALYRRGSAPGFPRGRARSAIGFCHFSFVDLLKSRQFWNSHIDGFTDYDRRKDRANWIFGALAEKLEGETRKHLISVNIAWDERGLGGPVIPEYMARHEVHRVCGRLRDGPISCLAGL